MFILRSSWHDSFFICLCISDNPRSKSQPFFISALLAHSSHISCIISLYPLLAPNLAVKYKPDVFHRQIFPSVFLIWEVVYFVVCVREKRTANIRSMQIESSILGIMEAPASYNTQTCCWGSTLNWVLVFKIFMCLVEPFFLIIC